MNTSKYNVNEIITCYADNIYKFCINRVNNIHDAEDLSQDILLEILRSISKSKQQINDMNAWVWSIARNRYARWCNKKTPPSISLDYNEIDLPVHENGFYDDSIDETDAVFTAVHNLAKSYREILIDCYVNELSYSEIAEQYKIPVNTVSTRIYYGKEKLRERWHEVMSENRMYNRINWRLACNGDVVVSKYLSRQVTRAIARAAYEKALTPSEISIVTGIPCMYIEDELPQLLNGEVIIEVNGKYLTNFIIHREDFLKKGHELVYNACENSSDKVEAILDKYDFDIRSIGFIGSDRPKNELLWYVTPVVVRKATSKVRELSGVLRPPYFPRIDGSYGWIFSEECPYDEEDKVSFGNSGCNSYNREKNILKYYWVGKYFSYELNNHFSDQKEFNMDKLFVLPKIYRGDIDDYSLGLGIKYNFIEKESDGYKCTLLYFTKEQNEKFEEITSKMADELSNLSQNLADAMKKIYDIYVSITPKHLHNQINGVIGGMTAGSESIICEIFERDGILAKPDSEYFTKQIAVIEK